MTVYDFVELLTDDTGHIRIYDVDNDCETVFDGVACDCRDFEDWAVCSIDPIYTRIAEDFIGLNCSAEGDYI